MKKIVIIIVLLISIAANAQQINRYKAVLFSANMYDEAREKWTEWSKPYVCDIDITISIDDTSAVLFIDNNDQERFFLKDEVERLKGVDDDGDTWDQLIFLSLDKNKKRLYVSIREYKSGIYIFQIQYSDISYKYQTR